MFCLKMSTKWDADYVTRFFELLENYPCIWDDSSPEYKSRKVREDGFKNLAQDMSLDMNIENFGMTEAKVKFNILKTAYQMEVRRMVKRNNSGSGHIYKPNVKWFPTADRFLKRTVKHIYNPNLPRPNRRVLPRNIQIDAKPIGRPSKDRLSAEVTIKFVSIYLRRLHL